MNSTFKKIISWLGLCLALILVVGFNMKSVSEADEAYVDLKIHYNNLDPKWYLHIWEVGKPARDVYFQGEDDYGKYAVVKVDKDTKQVGFLVRDEAWNKDVNEDRFVELGKGNEIWLKASEKNFYYENPDLPKKPKNTNIKIYYTRKDVNGWEVWLYNDKFELIRADFDKDDSQGRHYAEINIDGECSEVRYFIAKDKGAIREYEGADDKQSGYRYLKIKDGKATDTVVATNEPDYSKKEEIIFKVKNAKEGFGIWYWHEGEKGKFLKLTQGEDGFFYAKTEVPMGLDNISFIVTNQVNDTDGNWIRDINDKNNRQNSRSLNPKHQKGIEFTFGESITKPFEEKKDSKPDSGKDPQPKEKDNKEPNSPVDPEKKTDDKEKENNKDQNNPANPSKDKSGYGFGKLNLFDIFTTNKSGKTGTSIMDKRMKLAYDRLIIAYNYNRIMSKSARFLLENTPNTIAPVKDKLERQLKEADAILERTEKILKKLDETGLFAN